jgi:glutamate N-acetyltransferase / amino-acid N-acetyltransferase
LAEPNPEPGWALARNFRYAGVHCGLRPDPERRDLALFVSDRLAAAAGVFTQNRVVAAPVQLCRDRLPAADVRAVVVCSGNANACTGAQGLADTRRMAALTAEALGCRPEQVLVAATGVIGRLLPMGVFETGIPKAVGHLGAGADHLSAAAHAILTTDTRIKVETRALSLAGPEVRLTGVAKGAAMIGPNLATMLGFVFTDAAVRPADLHALLRDACDRTFNCVSVEGHTSTNDAVLALANGAGPPLRGADLAALGRALTEVCAGLAKAIAADAEGATKLVTIHVEGLRDDAEARRVARAVAESALVKTALFGNDPNWGRIVSAAGYCGVEFEESDLSLALGELLLYDRGTPTPLDPAVPAAYLKRNREVTLTLRFTLGAGRCTFYTCDLSTEYVRLNADYTT